MKKSSSRFERVVTGGRSETSVVGDGGRGTEVDEDVTRRGDEGGEGDGKGSGKRTGEGTRAGKEAETGAARAGS